MLKTFYLMREMSHSVLAADTLTSYLQDLETAAAAGRNLMTEKYARMENLIPSLNENELIYKIVDIEREWLSEYIKNIHFDNMLLKAALLHTQFANWKLISDATLNLYYS